MDEAIHSHEEPRDGIIPCIPSLLLPAAHNHLRTAEEGGTCGVDLVPYLKRKQCERILGSD